MMPRYELGSSYFKIINHQYLGRFCRKNLQPQVYLKASKTAEDFVMPTSIHTFAQNKYIEKYCILLNLKRNIFAVVSDSF